ncbi:7401_t:CDS:1, partial [Acaulospora colombiana]
TIVAAIDLSAFPLNTSSPSSSIPSTNPSSSAKTTSTARASHVQYPQHEHNKMLPVTTANQSAKTAKRPIHGAGPNPMATSRPREAAGLLGADSSAASLLRAMRMMERSMAATIVLRIAEMMLRMRQRMRVARIKGKREVTIVMSVSVAL